MHTRSQRHCTDLQLELKHPITIADFPDGLREADDHDWRYLHLSVPSHTIKPLKRELKIWDVTIYRGRYSL